MNALSEERFLQSDEVSFGADVSIIDGIEINEGDLGIWNAAREQLVTNLLQETGLTSATNAGNNLDEGLVDVRNEFV